MTCQVVAASLYRNDARQAREIGALVHWIIGSMDHWALSLVIGSVDHENHGSATLIRVKSATDSGERR